MDEPTSDVTAAPGAEKGQSTTFVRPRPREISTRRQLSKTRLGEAHGIFNVDVRVGSKHKRDSLVTRRQAYLRRRRRKHILIGIALILGLFPPMWAIYLVAWLVWRSRPKQKSMRCVRKAIRSLEKDRRGIALRELQEAHLLDPSNTDALYWLGLLLSSQNREDEAEEALSIVADRIPGLPEVESALVDAYIAMEEPESAVFHAQRLFDEAPHELETLQKLADAFEAAGKPDLAIQALHQAPLHTRVLTEPLVAIHYRLGTLYEKMGETEQARHHYDRVYSRDVTYKDIRSRRASLEGNSA